MSYSITVFDALLIGYGVFGAAFIILRTKLANTEPVVPAQRLWKWYATSCAAWTFAVAVLSNVNVGPLVWWCDEMQRDILNWLQGQLFYYDDFDRHFYGPQLAE